MTIKFIQLLSQKINKYKIVVCAYTTMSMSVPLTIHIAPKQWQQVNIKEESISFKMLTLLLLVNI